MVKCGKKFHIIICPFKDSLCKNGFLLIYLRESEMSVWTLDTFVFPMPLPTKPWVMLAAGVSFSGVDLITRTCKWEVVTQAVRWT